MSLVFRGPALASREGDAGNNATDHPARRLAAGMGPKAPSAQQVIGAPRQPHTVVRPRRWQQTAKHYRAEGFASSALIVPLTPCTTYFALGTCTIIWVDSPPSRFKASSTGSVVESQEANS